MLFLPPALRLRLAPRRPPPHRKPTFLGPGGGTGAADPRVCKAGGEEVGGRNLLCWWNSAAPRNFGVKFVRPNVWGLLWLLGLRRGVGEGFFLGGGIQGANHPRGRPRQRGVEQ